MKNPEHKENDSGYSQYARALRSAGPLLGSGIQLAASVVLMLFVGRWLDTKCNSSPWLMIAGAFIGFTAGLVSFIKMVNRIERNRIKNGER
jgi:F0F1-type ATP synthase assembly protein I